MWSCSMINLAILLLGFGLHTSIIYSRMNGPRSEALVGSQDSERKVSGEERSLVEANIGSQLMNVVDFCDLVPPDDPSGKTWNLHAVVESNARILGKTMSKVFCKGDMPASCATPSVVKAKTIAECPPCPCEHDLSKPLAYEYFRYASHFLKSACEGRSPPRILHLGLGLAVLVTNVKGTCIGSHNDVVELDPRLVELSSYFGGKWDGTEVKSCEVAVKDHLKGRSESPPCEQQYDFIVLDVFADSHTPEQCRDQDFAQNAFWLLRDDGCVITNLFARDLEVTKQIFGKIFASSCDVGNVHIWCKGTAKPDCSTGTITWTHEQKACNAFPIKHVPQEGSSSSGVMELRSTLKESHESPGNDLDDLMIDQSCTSTPFASKSLIFLLLLHQVVFGSRQGALVDVS